MSLANSLKPTAKGVTMHRVMEQKFGWPFPTTFPIQRMEKPLERIKCILYSSDFAQNLLPKHSGLIQCLSCLYILSGLKNNANRGLA